jgi:hypothetical protein
VVPPTVRVQATRKGWVADVSKKSRRNRSREAEWSAARAARDAVHKVRELIERYDGNPYLLLIGLGHIAGLLETYVNWLARQGVRDRRQATQLALLQLGLDLPPETPELARAAATKRMQDEIGTLRVAEAYVVSPAMHAVVAAAAETLERLDLVTLVAEEDIPSQAGFVLLPYIQLVKRAHEEQPSEVRALTWRLGTRPALDGKRVRVVQVVAWLAADGPIQFPDFIAVRRQAKEQGHPFPTLIPDARAFLRIDHDHNLSDEETRLILDSQQAMYGSVVENRTAGMGRLVGEFTGDVLQDQDQSFELRYLFAFWRLCAQRIAIVSRYREAVGDDPPVPPEVEDVRVIQLRSFSPLTLDDHEHDARRRYRHRWVVRMHKVRQWYPKEGVHKVLWRGPYIKGPDGAPLLSGEKVNALVR